LHLLLIRYHKDVDEILDFVFQKRVDLKGLKLERCRLSTGLLANIVDLYPDLEVLSLENCSQLTSTDYSLIPRLKKLSELNLSGCEVDYVYVKLLEVHVCILEVCRRTPLAIHFIYLGKKEIYCSF